MAPNFSAYPFERLRSLTRAQAQVESTLARWIAATRVDRDGVDRTVGAGGPRLAKLVGAPRAEVVPTSTTFDPFAARCEVRIGGASIDVRGGSLGVRAIAQHLYGGPAELAAPRPLGVVERSIFALVVATALEDLGVPGEVWPILDETMLDRARLDDGATRAGHAGAASKQRAGQAASSKQRAGQAASSKQRTDDGAGGPDPIVVELVVTLGTISLAVQLQAPPELLLRVPPARPLPPWFDTTVLDVPIAVGRCALARDDLDRLAVRTVITLERAAGNAELALPSGVVGLTAAPRALEATVATGYVARDMSLPDQAHVELTVMLGTTQLSLRQLSELAVGQIVQLGRPLAGPFELRAAGRAIGRGELVDVDGELAVRIVSLGD